MHTQTQADPHVHNYTCTINTHNHTCNYNHRRIYIYGEAWNFGEVVDNQRGINCSQLNLTGNCWWCFVYLWLLVVFCVRLKKAADNQRGINCSQLNLTGSCWWCFVYSWLLVVPFKRLREAADNQRGINCLN